MTHDDTLSPSQSPYKGDSSDPDYEAKKGAWDQLGLILVDEDSNKAIGYSEVV
jgi:hypothetical protein